MGKRKPNQFKPAETQKVPERYPLAISVPAQAPRAAPYRPSEAPPAPAPRQRGRPRKVPLEPGFANHRENSVNSGGTIMKVLLRQLKEKDKPWITANNGFARGLKPDIIMAGFRHCDQMCFAVRFKNRKLPELISPMELKLRAPSLLIQYYVSHMVYTYNL